MKPTTLIAAAALVVATLAADARGQEMTPEQMAAWQEAMTPGGPHQHLANSVGTWEGTTTMWFEPGAEPIQMPTRRDAEMILGGRWLREEYSGPMLGQEFHGVGLNGYDNERDEFVSIWMDNMSTAPMITRGTLDEATNAITLEGTVDDPIEGARDVPVRTVLHFRGPDTMVFEMYIPAPDGHEFKTMEVTLDRIGGAE